MDRTDRDSIACFFNRMFPKLRTALCVRILLISVLLALATEGTARFVLGFGSPPIVLLDDEIEYYLKPSQHYKRFGNQIKINAFGMRGEDFSPHKTQADELRVLVLGDSVVYGGHRVDQSEIATSLLPVLLEKELGRPVTVANIASSSWGPPNILAYLKRFGVFDADIAILVISSHDIIDVPLHDHAIQPYWTKPAWCATHDAIQSIRERLFISRDSTHQEVSEATSHEAKRAQVLAATTQIFDLLTTHDIRVFVAFHLTRPEVLSQPAQGHDIFMELVQARGIQTIQLGSAFGEAIRSGQQPYRDQIHPAPDGMALMAQEFSKAILQWDAGNSPTL